MNYQDFKNKTDKAIGNVLEKEKDKVIEELYRNLTREQLSLLESLNAKTLITLYARVCKGRKAQLTSFIERTQEALDKSKAELEDFCKQGDALTVQLEAANKYLEEKGE